MRGQKAMCIDFLLKGLRVCVDYSPDCHVLKMYCYSNIISFFS